MIMPVFAPHDNHGALIRDIARPMYRAYGRGFSLATHAEKPGLDDARPLRQAAAPRKRQGTHVAEEDAGAGLFGGDGDAWRGRGCLVRHRDSPPQSRG